MTGKPILYGRDTSSNVQKVMWLLRELDVDFEQIQVGGPFGGLDNSDYDAMNPNKLVPTLVDGDLTLWESHAILRYVAAKFGKGRMWPEDPAARAPIDQWTDWAAFEWQPAWLGVFIQRVRLMEEFRNTEAITAAVARAEARLEIMDRYLRKTPWLAGEEFSYADIACGVAMHRWATMDIERRSFDGVEAWRQRLLNRPLFAEIVSVSYEGMYNTLSP
jgi:glutathione S-transferase